MAQTAVEWLYANLTKAHPTESKQEILRQANEMFQKQIQDAHIHADRYTGPLAKHSAWEYYRDNFKKQ